MENNYTLSVVMPLYYKEKPEYLDISLQSLYNQTVPAEEIILVKEGKLSNEHNKILNKWSALFEKGVLKIIDAGDEKGLPRCLNMGINASKYTYIARFDSDDKCLPDRFEKQLNYFKNNPDVVLLGGQIEEYDQNMESSLGIRKVPLDLTSIKRFIKLRSPFNHQTVIYKRDIVLKLGGYPLFENSEDYALWGLFVANRYRVANLDETLVHARTGKGLIIRRSGLTFLKRELRAIRFLYEIKLLNFPYYVLSTSMRIVIRLIPLKWLQYMYGLMRRDSVR